MVKKTQSQTILLVDDQPQQLYYLETILKEDGLNLIKSNSGMEAIKIAKQTDIDLILLDVQMPEMDGFKTATCLQNLNETNQIPIILVTALVNTKENVHKGYDTGAVDFLNKPIDIKVLKRKVKIFLDLSKDRKKLKENLQELQTEKINMDSILQNAANAIFFINRYNKIRSRYSEASKNILSQDNLKNIDFLKYIEKKVPSVHRNNLESFLELMFNAEINENLVEKLNPLDKIEVLFKDDLKKHKTTRVLSFNFKRVFGVKGQLNELMVSVTDHTENELLKKRLDEAELDSKGQLDLLYNILHVDSTLLNDFLQSTQKEINKINDLLKDEKKTERYLKILKTIYYSMQIIKGNASLLALRLFVEKAYLVQEKILNIQNSEKIDGRTFIPLTLYIKEIQDLLLKINKLVTTINPLQNNFRPNRKHECKLFFVSLENFIKDTSYRLKKKVKFNYQDFDLYLIPYSYTFTIKEILIQLISNSLYHGIEKAGARITKGKDSFGKIEITSTINNNNLTISYSDDGQGIQTDKIRKKAQELGKWNNAEVATWNDKKVENLIYGNGITTFKEKDLMAGKGIGMDIIRQKIKAVNGKIELESRPGQYCKFKISFSLLKKS